MGHYSIKDLEYLSGIKAHTIRIWEQRYSFLKPQRSDTNIRYYSSNELKTILNIALLNKYGFKISHIDKMNELQMKDRILSLSHAQAQQERVVNELIQNMVDLDLDAFELILDKYIQSKGIERSITQIIFPFLERIGILWLTNHINPAQEHLVTNIIRQKLIIGIEGARSLVKVDKTYPLLCADIAIKNKIPHYLLVSSTGGDTSSMLLYLRTKGEVERDLKLKKLQMLSILKPGLIKNRPDARFG